MRCNKFSSSLWEVSCHNTAKNFTVEIGKKHLFYVVIATSICGAVLKHILSMKIILL